MPVTTLAPRETSDGHRPKGAIAAEGQRLQPLAEVAAKRDSPG